MDVGGAVSFHRTPCAKISKGAAMISTVLLENFLSFGGGGEKIILQPLNIIIGTNGSGKSNFLEAFDLLRDAPTDIQRPILEGGGVLNWLHKGGHEKGSHAFLGFDIKNGLPNAEHELGYLLSFHEVANTFAIEYELIASPVLEEEAKMLTFYNSDGLHGSISVNYENGRKVEPVADISPTQSILAQKRDTRYYPEITYLANVFSKIKLYRNWTFGQYAPQREPQRIDMKNDYLEPDCSNLCLVLNELRNDLPTKRKILKELQEFYEDVEDYEITFVGSRALIFFQERGLKTSVPATRLSDGTLRYLCLLSILCHPNPPPLVCIEEPELGMHPDIIPNIARLLTEASERCQLIITTHSEILIDAFTEKPEAILIAEKTSDGTQLKRLSKEELKPWLENYRLGNLWSSGEIGGTRW